MHKIKKIEVREHLMESFYIIKMTSSLFLSN